MKNCPTGKRLNPITNRCNKIKCPKGTVFNSSTDNCDKKKCPPGKILNKNTSRCNKIICKKNEVFNKVLNKCEKKVCPPGKILNRKTNRCNKIKFVVKKLSSKKKIISKPRKYSFVISSDSNNNVKKKKSINSKKIISKPRKYSFVISSDSNNNVKKKKSSSLQKKKSSSKIITSLGSNSDMILMKDKVKKTTFSGTSALAFYGMLYLSRKYKNVALPITYKNFYLKPWKFEETQIMFTCKYQKKRYSVRKDFSLSFPVKNTIGDETGAGNFFKKIKKIEKDKSKDFVLCYIYVMHGCYKPGAHANMMIINLKNKEIERFEPHGKKNGGSNNPQPIYNELDRRLKKISTENGYKYIKPMEYCPYIGPQTKEELYDGLKHYKDLNNQTNTSEADTLQPTDPGGFCSAWSLWYADIRMRNPNIERGKLIAQAIEKIKNKPIKFRQFIRNYAEFIVKLSKTLDYNDSEFENSN